MWPILTKNSGESDKVLTGQGNLGTHSLNIDMKIWSTFAQGSSIHKSRELQGQGMKLYMERI